VHAGFHLQNFQGVKTYVCHIDSSCLEMDHNSLLCRASLEVVCSVNPNILHEWQKNIQN